LLPTLGTGKKKKFHVISEYLVVAMLSKNGQIVDKRKKLFASCNPLKTPVEEKPNNYVLGRT